MGWPDACNEDSALRAWKWRDEGSRIPGRAGGSPGTNERVRNDGLWSGCSGSAGRDEARVSA